MTALALLTVVFIATSPMWLAIARRTRVETLWWVNGLVLATLVAMTFMPQVTLFTWLTAFAMAAFSSREEELA